MMKFFKSPLMAALMVVVLVFTQCSKDDPEPTTAKISGKVTDVETEAALADVSVILFDANSFSPIQNAKTNSTGDYSFTVDAGGNYFLKYYKQGYISTPPPGSSAVSFEVVLGQDVIQPAEMTPSDVTNAGYISGTVTVGGTGKAGVLVVAEAEGVAYSAVSDENGNYSIFNIPAGSYEVRSYVADHSGNGVPASVTANTETSSINVALTAGVATQVSGTFKVISQTTIETAPAKMDISLVHPVTREAIPGLSLSVPYHSSLDFTFDHVPNGDYVLRATFANDYIVIDPDYITKFGEYEVSVSGGIASPESIDIVATSAVLLNTPSNEMSTTMPVSASTVPTFTWSAYPSTSDYVIEVTDATTGAIIWGGFSNNGTTKNIVIPGNTTSIAFNSDDNASIATLTPGRVYRWRVYASKNDQNATTGWTLIAASEDQMGLVKIQ